MHEDNRRDRWGKHWLRWVDNLRSISKTSISWARKLVTGPIIYEFHLSRREESKNHVIWVFPWPWATVGTVTHGPSDIQNCRNRPDRTVKERMDRGRDREPRSSPWFMVGSVTACLKSVFLVSFGYLLHHWTFFKEEQEFWRARNKGFDQKQLVISSIILMFDTLILIMFYQTMCG